MHNPEKPEVYTPPESSPRADYWNPDRYKERSYIPEPLPVSVEEDHDYIPENLQSFAEVDEQGEQQQTEKAYPQTGQKVKNKKGIAGLLGGLGAVVATLSKFQGLMLLLKFAGTGLTAFASIFLYSMTFGWPFAIGIVSLIFIHELGHALFMRLKGIPVRGIVFIPFLGAATMMSRLPANARDAAEVGIAGPIAGALGATFCFFMAQTSNTPHIWALLAYFGFFLNLFNLIPVMPFDGGMIVSAINRWLWVVGFLILLGIQIWQWTLGNSSIWLLFIVAMAAIQLFVVGFRVREDSPEGKAYYAISGGIRILLTVLYFGLIASLYLGMYLVQTTMLG